MTRDDLSSLLRDHVAYDEPPSLLPGPALEAGRRRVRRGRFVVAGTTVAVLAVAGALALPALSGDTGGGRESAMDPASQRALAEYDPLRMPRLMDDHVRPVLERSVPDLGPSTFSARDDQGQNLPERYWGKASGLSVGYGDRDHAYDVSISHARSEAEGDPEDYCVDGLESGYAVECTVDRTAEGDVVISKLEALKPFAVGDGASWMIVTVDELDTIDVADLWFARTVKVIKSETLLTYVTERVKATDRAPESADLVVPDDDLVAIGTDAELVMPVPPPGDDGCPAWTMETKDFDVSCD